MGLLSCENGVVNKKGSRWPQGACTVLWTSFKILLINFKYIKTFFQTVFILMVNEVIHVVFERLLWVHGKKGNK